MVARIRLPLEECQHCWGPMPAAAATGRPRTYCSLACRKAAYEARRARRPGAVVVRRVDQVVVELCEVVHVVDEGHDIGECVHRVVNSPRAVANVLNALAALARADMLRVNRWQPTRHSLISLYDALRAGPVGRDH